MSQWFFVILMSSLDGERTACEPFYAQLAHSTGDLFGSILVCHHAVLPENGGQPAEER